MNIVSENYNMMIEMENISDIALLDTNSLSVFGQKINKYFNPDKDLSFFLAKKEKTEYIYNVVYLEGNP
jgi:hypothetical protein